MRGSGGEMLTAFQMWKPRLIPFGQKTPYWERFKMTKDRKSWGGARRGAGRKQGTKNPRTIARAEAARLVPFCADPLQWLLNVVTDGRQDIRLRVDAARAAMPYCHARL